MNWAFAVLVQVPQHGGFLMLNRIVLGTIHPYVGEETELGIWAGTRTVMALGFFRAI